MLLVLKLRACLLLVQLSTHPEHLSSTDYAQRKTSVGGGANSWPSFSSVRVDFDSQLYVGS